MVIISGVPFFRILRYIAFQWFLAQELKAPGELIGKAVVRRRRLSSSVNTFKRHLL